jgi:hypothetical protein
MTKTRSLFEKVRLVKQVNGVNHALGLYGTAEDIQAVFMTLSNSGVTGGELLDLGGETFAYIWTSAEKFAWYLAKWEAGVLSGAGKLEKRDKFAANEWFYNVWKFWADMFEAAESEEFVPENATVDLACLGIGMEEKPARLATCEE